MGNIIVLAIIVGILSASVWKYRSEKKKGAKCVGCPLSGSNGSSSCSCPSK